MKEFPFDPYDFFGYLASGYIVIAGLEILIGVPQILGQELKIFDIIITSLGAYIAGQIVASPSKFILEDMIVKQLLLAPSITLMNQQSGNKFIRFLLPGYYVPLPNQIRDRIINSVTREGCSDAEGEALFLHIRFQNDVRSDTHLMLRLGTFLNKYGFNRNLSFTCCLFAISIFVAYGVNPITDEVKYAYIAAIVGILLFLRYLKFFRQYSYELFNSYAGKRSVDN